ncbi:MAG TPA: flagellar motor protein MotB [Nitrospiria bacterium]
MNTRNLIFYSLLAGSLLSLGGCGTMKELRGENEDLKAEINRLESVINDYSDELDKIKSLSNQEKAVLRSEMQQMRTNLRENLEEEIRKNEALVQKVNDLTIIEVGEAALFGSGQADLTKKGTSVIGNLVKTLNQYSGYHVRVEGHTDSVPIGENLKSKFQSNWELSTVRATTVVRYMIYGMNMDPKRLSAVGYAKYRPVASNDTPQGRAKNRRIRLVVFKEITG